MKSIHSRDGHISVLVEVSWQFSQARAVRRAEAEIAAVLLSRSFEFETVRQ